MKSQIRNILISTLLAIFTSVSVSAEEGTPEPNRKKAEAQLKAAREQAKKMSRDMEQKHLRRPRRGKKKSKHVHQETVLDNQAPKH
jgi:hypothetical protein